MTDHSTRDSPSALAKSPQYYKYVRTEILPLLPRRFQRLLDVGCGEGATARYLKDQGYCAWAGGIELSASAAATARQRLDLVLEADLNAPLMPDLPTHVDVILCLDVLEHLVDPWSCIDRLSALLVPGGVLVASIPNVRNIRALLPLLLLGRWEYVEAGILDNTHLRFFTRRSAISLLRRGELVVERVKPHYGVYLRHANAATLSIFSDFLAQQYLIRARRQSAVGKSEQSA